MDGGHDNMGGHRSDRVGLVGHAWRAEIGGEPVGLGGGVGDDVRSDEDVQGGRGEVGDWREADTAEPRAFPWLGFRSRRRRRRGVCPGASARARLRADHPGCGREFRSRRPPRGRPAACGPARPWRGAASWRGPRRSCRSRGPVRSSAASPTCRWNASPSGRRPRTRRWSGRMCAVHHRAGGDRGLLAALFVTVQPDIFDPFPHVSVHVVKTPRGCRISPNIMNCTPSAVHYPWADRFPEWISDARSQRHGDGDARCGAGGDRRPRRC